VARVVVVVAGSENDCYSALGVLHGRWHPVDDRCSVFRELTISHGLM